MWRIVLALSAAESIRAARSGAVAVHRNAIAESERRNRGRDGGSVTGRVGLLGTASVSGSLIGHSGRAIRSTT